MNTHNKKVSGDLFYNYISVAVTAICGAIFSIIIGYYYDVAVLGRFYTIYAYYIILSQFCVCGVHMAIVKYAAEEQDSEYGLGLLFKSVAVCIISSSIIIVPGAIVTNLCLINTLNRSMVTSINTIWGALFFFSINKVFLGWLNGHSKMKAYAFFQASRNLFIATSLLVFAFFGLSGEMLTYCFLISEIMLSFLGVLFLMIKHERLHFSNSTASMKSLAWFGLRILPSNTVLELNTKIDVICLSFILQDERLVGIYSFAAMFGEGFYQLFVVIRKIINPRITRQRFSHTLKFFIIDFKAKYLMRIYLGFSIAGAILAGGFVILVHIIDKNDYMSGLEIMTILCIAMIINSKSIVFGNILSQTGFPFDESVLNVATTASNGILNIILILRFNIIGSALATGLSYFVFSIILKYQVKRKLGISL